MITLKKHQEPISVEIPPELEKLLIQSVEINQQRAQAALQAELQAAKQQKALELMAQSGLGSRFQQRTFATFKPNSDNYLAYESCLEFAKNFNIQHPGLLITGDVGQGKTHLAAAIANHLLANHHPVIFGNITNIISLIRTSYQQGSQLSESQLLDIMTNVELLILDDLGKEGDTNHTNSLVYQIVNRRYENNQPLVVTTNLTPGQMTNKLGSATCSRLVEMCIPINLEGPDWRQKKWA